jgi:hypothetical protein
MQSTLDERTLRIWAAKLSSRGISYVAGSLPSSILASSLAFDTVATWHPMICKGILRPVRRRTRGLVG